jgi:hypothetical protein
MLENVALQRLLCKEWREASLDVKFAFCNLQFSSIISPSEGASHE